MERVTAIALATNQDGRLELLALADSKEGSAVLWHRWERLEGGWSDWQSLGPVGGIRGNTLVVQAPAVAQNKRGCLEVVTIAGTMGLDDEVYRAWQQYPGRAWRRWHAFKAPRGETTLSTPVLGQNKDGRLELFALDVDRAVWHLFQNDNGDWLQEWHPLGKPTPLGASSDMVVARNKDGRLELFVQGSDFGVWHCWQRREGGWSPWKSLGHASNGARYLAVGAHADGRLVLFTTATAPYPPDGSPPYIELWWREQVSLGGWSEWRSIGVAPEEDTRSEHRSIRRLTLALNADRRLELFGVIGGKGSAGLYWLRQTSPSGIEWEGAWVDLQPAPPSQGSGSHLSA